MVQYFGLVVSENANAIGYAYGEYGQFGYKLDAQRASGAAAMIHYKRPREEGANTSSCRGANFGSIAAETAYRGVSAGRW